MLRFLVVTLFMTGLAVALPADIIMKCVLSDAKCLKQATARAIPAFAKGIPELGVEPLEPLILKEIDASIPNLKLVLRDYNFVGLSTCKPKKIQYDAAKSQLYTRLICDVQAEGLYEMKGQLLVLPIEGKGKMHLKINKIRLNADCDVDTEVGPDGKKYWVIKDSRHSYEITEKADLVFDNLFENNEVLRTATTELIANNSNEIINDVGGPIFQALSKELMKNLSAFFSHVPYEDITLD